MWWIKALQAKAPVYITATSCNPGRAIHWFRETCVLYGLISCNIFRSMFILLNLKFLIHCILFCLISFRRTWHVKLDNHQLPVINLLKIFPVRINMDMVTHQLLVPLLQLWSFRLYTSW